MWELAGRVGRIDSSGIRKVFDLARSLRDPIDLSIGQPDFDVPEAVKEAAIAAIRDGRNKYTQTQGIAELRAAAAEEERRFTGRAYGEGEVLITSGVSGGLFLALLALIEDGDEVVVPDPYFVMYKHLVRLFGGRPVYLDTAGEAFLVDPDRLDAAITPRTKLVLLNSPSNPTGRIQPRETLAGIAEVCRRRGVPVLSDEIYRAFAYAPMTSMAELYEHTLVLAGHSKAYGMTGWRLGYAAGPRHLIQAMATVQQYSFVCAPSIAQHAALACPQVDLSGPIERYRRKRDLMVDVLGRRFELAAPDGAFYLWLRVPAGMTGTAFVEEAIRRNVLVIPGNVFSERDDHVRICYTVGDDALREGAQRLCAIAEG